MFLENERLVKTGKVVQPANKGLHLDNEVLSTVEHKYSLMDEQHARMRVEALAGRHPNNSGPDGRTEIS